MHSNSGRRWNNGIYLEGFYCRKAMQRFPRHRLLIKCLPMFWGFHWHPIATYSNIGMWIRLLCEWHCEHIMSADNTSDTQETVVAPCCFTTPPLCVAGNPETDLRHGLATLSDAGARARTIKLANIYHCDSSIGRTPPTSIFIFVCFHLAFGDGIVLAR